MKKKLILIGVGAAILASTAAAIYLLKGAKEIAKDLNLYLNEDYNDKDEFAI